MRKNNFVFLVVLFVIIFAGAVYAESCGPFSFVSPKNVSSGSYNNAEQKASNSIDSSTTTYWSSSLQKTWPHSINFDMGVKTCINGVKVTFFSDYFPMNISVETSDDAVSWNFVTYWWADSVVSGAELTKEFPTVQARYVRLKQLWNDGATSRFALKEVKISAASNGGGSGGGGSSSGSTAVCTDTDGGKNYTVKGNATGIYGTGYDICMPQPSGIVWIQEAFCQSDGSTANIATACPSGTVCYDGACIINSTAPQPVPNAATCVDSDGGLSYSLKGEVKFNKLGTAPLASYYDGCMIRSGDTSYPTSSCFGNNCYLNELSCNSENNMISSEYTCSNGCRDGVCIARNVTSNECSALVNKMVNPVSFSRNNINYSLGWNDTYTGSWYVNGERKYYTEYSASWYSSYIDGDFDYNNINYNVMVFEDKNVNTSQILEDRLSYRVCQVNSYYENDNKNYVYICNWDILNNNQNMDTSQSKSRQILWNNENTIVEISVWSGGRQLSDWEIAELRSKKLNEFVNDLKDNQFEYLDWENFDLEYPAESEVQESLSQCPSGVTLPYYSGTNQTCWPSLSCKIEPAICPEYGSQKRICINSCDNSKREETLYCSPGICSGCYAPRWFGSNDNICLPYGIRFSQQTEWNLENVSVDYSDTDGLSVEDALRSNGEIGLIVYPNSTALLTLESTQDVFTNIVLEKGKTYDWSSLIGDSDNSIKYTIYVDNVEYNSENYNKSFIEVTFKASGFEERRTDSSFNAYCDFDGQVKQQKTKFGDQWATCQNNYECESNFCSSGSCVEVNDLISEARGLKGLAVRVLCRLANIFDREDYNSCIVQYLQ